ncbi:DUF6414 family protein [Kaistella montana]|uniref:Uncharacterized protein n=1 Tax=Kaistella montana TaxID=1849733 RepID=A0ABW5KAC8_9FLAO|nr:hypothetical protein [Kaistella montana]MCQ4035498.1 hypothetical protein [Kaistella montana]
METIKDLIYFDFEKVKSISSQISGGFLQEVSRAFEDESNFEGGIGFNLQIVKGNTGGKTTEKTIKTEKVELFHEVLNQLERDLSEKNILTNINETFRNGNISFSDFTKKFEELSFVKASGWSKFEDFKKLKLISSNINDISRFINYDNLKNNPELNSLRIQVNDKKKEISKNKSAHHKDFIALSNIEKKLDKMIEDNLGVTLFDEKWIEGMKTFLDTFSPDRLNFRLLPFDEFSDFQILASLEEKNLTIGDYNRLIYTYGSRPNLKLTVLGILTSSPAEEDKRKHTDDEFILLDDEKLNETMAFEKAFRNMFSTFENLDKFFFVPTYPKIGIYPLAIYREITY